MVGPMLHSCYCKDRKSQTDINITEKNRIILRVERGAALLEKYVLNFANKQNYVLFCN